MKEFPAWEIHMLTRHIKDVMEHDPLLQDIWVRGEISNYKLHSSGHAYFSMKDEFAQLRCVMFKSKAGRVDFLPKNGDMILARGSISVYERDGSYQFYVEEMRASGVGDLHQAFEELKRKLDAEGLFNVKFKKSLPYLPKRIGIVTSPTGAAIRDIISVTRRRYENMTLTVIPVRVQGEDAPGEIAEAIQRLNSFEDVDVIIVGRGGGSFEELNAFNQEIVARSIFASSIPVVSAIGHETDFTIADFVADVRAPTPSAAAEIVVPDKRELLRNLSTAKTRMEYLLKRKLRVEKSRFEQVLKRPVLSRPLSIVQQHILDVDRINKSLYKSINNKMTIEKEKFISITTKLNMLSPLHTLGRGFAICEDFMTGEPIQRIDSVRPEQVIKTSLKDGSFISCVTKIMQEDTEYE